MNSYYIQYFCAFFFSLSGVAFVWAGNIINRKKQLLLDKGIRTKGQVVDNIKELIGIENTPTLSDYTYFPVIAFKTLEGILIEEKNKIGVSYLSQSEIGDEVDIIYNNTNPKDFIIYKSGYMFQGTLFIILGALFFIFGVGAAIAITLLKI